MCSRNRHRVRRPGPPRGLPGPASATERHKEQQEPVHGSAHHDGFIRERAGRGRTSASGGRQFHRGASQCPCGWRPVTRTASEPWRDGLQLLREGDVGSPRLTGAQWVRRCRDSQVNGDVVTFVALPTFGENLRGGYLGTFCACVGNVGYLLYFLECATPTYSDLGLNERSSSASSRDGPAASGEGAVQGARGLRDGLNVLGGQVERAGRERGPGRFSVSSQNPHSFSPSFAGASGIGVPGCAARTARVQPVSGEEASAKFLAMARAPAGRAGRAPPGRPARDRRAGRHPPRRPGARRGRLTTLGSPLRRRGWRSRRGYRK